MSKLIQDIVPLGAGLGEFTRLDYGMDECDWRASAGPSAGHVIGWWEGKVGALDFPATEADEAVWLVEGASR